LKTLQAVSSAFGSQVAGRALGAGSARPAALFSFFLFSCALMNLAIAPVPVRLRSPSAAISMTSQFANSVSFHLNPLNDDDDALLHSCMRLARTTLQQQSAPRKRRRSPSKVPGDTYWVHYEKSTRLGKLYCRTGFHLLINSDGKVNGTHQDHNRFGVLEFLSVAFGLVSIKGKESNRYLCMNSRGRLYGSFYFCKIFTVNHSTECIFMEKMLENYYNTYTSCRYSRRRRKWFVALNKRGRPRRGNRSRNKQKYAQFLVLHLDDEDFKGHRRHKLLTNSPFGLDSFTQKWRSEKFSSLPTGGRPWRRMYRRRNINKQQVDKNASRSSVSIANFELKKSHQFSKAHFLNSALIRYR
ncbi:Fibroblast growth factor 20, partial [Trichinella papuae]